MEFKMSKVQSHEKTATGAAGGAVEMKLEVVLLGVSDVEEVIRHQDIGIERRITVRLGNWTYPLFLFRNFFGRGCCCVLWVLTNPFIVRTYLDRLIIPYPLSEAIA